MSLLRNPRIERRRRPAKFSGQKTGSGDGDPEPVARGATEGKRHCFERIDPELTGALRRFGACIGGNRRHKRGKLHLGHGVKVYCGD
jgi:hypothetical protein